MNVVQIGAGKMGMTWLDILRETTGITLAGVVEPNDAAWMAAATRSGLPESAMFASLEAALDAVQFKAAVVVTPPPTHRPIAEGLMRAGIHVLTERPLATSLDDAHAMIRTAEETGATLMVAQNYRFTIPFITVRSLVESGAIGPVCSISIRFDRDGRTMYGEGDFRYSMEHVLLMDMSIHHLDMLRALTGRNAIRVYAQSWHVPDGNFAHDAAASVLLTLEDGIHVSYQGNWAPHTRDTSWNGDWEIVGDLGRIVWADDADRTMHVSLHCWGEPPRAIEPVSATGSGRDGMLDDFTRAVETGTPPPTAASDNVRSLGIVFAAIESIETGNAVNLRV